MPKDDLPDVLEKDDELDDMIEGNPFDSAPRSLLRLLMRFAVILGVLIAFVLLWIATMSFTDLL